MCDARNICSKTEYDRLNRPWKVSYPSSRQPTVTTHYDLGYDADHHATRGKVTEILTAEVANDTGTSWDDSIPATRLGYTYDQWGRMVGSSQDLDWDSEHNVYVHTYDFKYKYNLGGQLIQQEYPSHRLVNFGFDDAGRLSNVNSGAGHVYVDAFTYTAQGLVSGYTLGNGATVSLGYGTNGRLQLSEITLTKNGTTLQKYQYTYGQINTSGTVDTTKNNGQLAQVDSWIGSTQEYRQQFKYDCLNRLLNAKEKYGTSLGSTAYDINYEFDTFGNRYQKSSANSGNSAIVQKWVEAGDYDLTNNRFQSDVAYDEAGNIIADPRFRDMIYGYDANGRQDYSAQANGSSPVTVIFDGAGQKVATKASGYLSVSVYDAGGKLAAEYSQFAAPTTANVDFITPNYQGSTAVVTDNSGTVKSRHDYLPFGEELAAGVGSRTTGKMFGQPDSVRQKYAGMETDDATGLNHTLWRKDDNWSGRWTSPDPYGGSMSTADPQSFNRYAYVNNDPVNHMDPLGLTLADCGIYQTEDPEEAKTMQQHYDGIFQKAQNDSATDRWYKTPWGSMVKSLSDNFIHDGGQQSLSAGGRTVALWLNNPNDPDNTETFKQCADAAASGPGDSLPYTDGDDLLKQLYLLSKTEIMNIFIFGHASPAGMMGVNPETGLYMSDTLSDDYRTTHSGPMPVKLQPDARRTSVLAGAIKTGQINLAGGATISFIGCNTSALALDLSKQLAGVDRRDVSVSGVSNSCNLIPEVRGVRVTNETTGLSGGTLGTVQTFRQGNKDAFHTSYPARKRLIGGLW
jgi:RHS repeat-associated protein